MSGLYVRETQSPRQVALGMLLIPLVVSLCVVPIAFDETGGPMWLAWTITAVVLVVVVLLARPFFGPGRHWWLYVFEGGFADLDHRGRVRHSARWEEIADADWEWQAHEDDPGSSLAGYQLRAADGRTFRFSKDLTDAQDPSRTLEEVLDAALITPMTQRALHALDAGQSLQFGKVTSADRLGITYDRKPALAWNEIAAWKLDDGKLVLERVQGKKLVLPLSRVPGSWILTRILAERAQPSR